MQAKMRFDDAEIAAVYRAIFERRDMRHFKPGNVEAETLKRLLRAAHHAPSVGFMQPWRIIHITDPALRVALLDVDEVRRLLQMPEGAKPVAMLCLGHVEAFYERPMLEAQGWASRVPLERC